MLDFQVVKNYKVLMVGDGITDEYRYVTPIGKSIKDNVISTRYERREIFHGGVWAAAAHVRNLCHQVDVFCGPNVMRNLRYVEETYFRKLLTVHRSHIDETYEAKDYHIPDYDLVIVTDFGHGVLHRELIKRLTNEARFLAVNAQTNSTNFGFNLITKYPRADYVVLDELEARLATHDKDSPIERVIEELGYQKIIVTQGSNGAIGFDGETFYRESSRAEKVVDTLGAGDAFLSISAPFALAGGSIGDLVKIGNAAGAIKVGIVGHRRSINREDLSALLGDRV